jgi:hypothetical protein
MSLPVEYIVKPKPEKSAPAPKAELPPQIELDVDFEDMVEPPDSDDVYFQELGGHRLNTSDLQSNHSMTSNLPTAESMNARMKRFNQEIKILSKDAPCTPDNAIYTLVDENRYDLFKSLVSGTAETPYAYGLYLFDICCPEDFPRQPPKVNIMTTGEG